MGLLICPTVFIQHFLLVLIFNTSFHYFCHVKDFAAIDFETANNERTSVCSVGVVIVREGEFVDSFYSLIQPEPNYYL